MRGSPATFLAWVRGLTDIMPANKTSLASNCLKCKPWAQPSEVDARMEGLPFWTTIRKWIWQIEDQNCFKELQLLDIFSVPRTIEAMARTLQSVCNLVSDYSAGLLYRWIEFLRLLKRVATRLRSRRDSRPFLLGRSAPPEASQLRHQWPQPPDLCERLIEPFIRRRIQLHKSIAGVKWKDHPEGNKYQRSNAHLQSQLGKSQTLTYF